MAGDHSYISVYGHALARTKDTALRLRKKLFGHREAVNCMSSSDNHRFCSLQVNKGFIVKLVLLTHGKS